MKPVREARLAQTIISILSEQQSDIEAASVSQQASSQIPNTQPQTRQKVKAGSLKIIPGQESAEAAIEILVAEDFKLNQDVVRLMLIDSKFKPVFANNGDEAVNMFSSEPDRFALVLMDVSMPVMDGLTATRWIRENIELKSQPKIMVMTATMMSEAKQAWQGIDVDGFIEKPVRIDHLKSILSEVVEQIREGE